jgi:hypothetical protein
MREWVAHNKTIPIEILDILSNDTDERVRSMVASKRKLPEYLQMKLAIDTDSGVRHRIASNPKATKKVLEMLLDDEWSVIRELTYERIEKKEYVG